MNKSLLPSDVIKHIKRKLFFSTLLFFLLELAVFIIIYYLGDRIFSGLGNIGQIISYIILICIPFIITRFPFSLINDSWEGEVTKVDIQTVTAFTKEGKPRLFYQNEVHLTIKRSDGKIITKKVNSFDARNDNRLASPSVERYSAVKPEHFIEKYAKGDKVYHFHGLKHLLIVSPNDKQHTSCVICGQDNRLADGSCWFCGYTLINILDK